MIFFRYPDKILDENQSLSPKLPYFTQCPFCTSVLTTILFLWPLLPEILVYFSDLLAFKYVNFVTKSIYVDCNVLHILKILICESKVSFEIDSLRC